MSTESGRPLRVLHVHSGNLFGGVERILETLACRPTPGLMQSAFALCFTGRLSDTLGACGAVVDVLGPVRISRPWQMLRAQRALAKVLAASRPDLAVVHSAWSHWIFGSTIRRHCPLVRWLHAPETGRSWQERAAARVPPSLAICNSRYTCDASRHSPGVPYVACYAPVAIDVRSDGLSRVAIRQSLQTPLDDVVVVMAARMEAWKGHHTLIDALKQLEPGLPWRCWIAGGAQRPSEAAHVEALSAHVAAAGLTGRVQFIGERRDVMDVFAAADVYCQPNDGAEPFGLSFVEALAAGLPVVSTKLGAVTEIVDDSCALLVPAQSPAALAAALREVVADASRRAALSASARVRARAFTDVPERLRVLAGVLGQAGASGSGARREVPVDPSS